MTLRKTLAAGSALIALTAFPACAQPAPQAQPTAAALPADADPALWVVKDADTTIYLFGTVHVLKPGLTWFDEAVKAAFDKSDGLVLEMVQPDQAAMQQLVMKIAVNPTGPTLTEQVPEAKRAAYAKALADAGVPPAAFDRLRPWFAAVTLSIIPLTRMGYDPKNGPETILADAARAASKPVTGLETAEQQFGFFNSLSPGAQMTFLTSTLDELPKLGTSMQTMVVDWAEGDPEGLAAQLNDNLKDSPEVADAILYGRNKTWAGWIAERMTQPGTVFVAVGAGHLAGPRSVQSELGAYKLKAVRVTY